MMLPSEDDPAAGRAAYAAVDDALRSFPLRPAPPGLAAAVLAELRSPEDAVARPSFHLSWMDFALSGLMALMAGLALWLPGWVTPQTAARLQMMLTAPLSQGDALVWGLAMGALPIMAGLLLLAGLVFRGPGSLQRL